MNLLFDCRVNLPQGLSIQYGVVEVSPKGPNRIKVKRVIVHEQFDIDSPGIVNDIAILEVNYYATSAHLHVKY